MTDSVYAIKTDNLLKKYPAKGQKKAKNALDGVSLSIEKGKIFGLLGPNGAGKSTLISILGGTCDQTSGTAEILGVDVTKQRRAASRLIGIVPQELTLDPFFSPKKTLELMAGLYGVPKRERRTKEILEAVGLSDKANADAFSLSGGMKRRLMVAKAMVHSPPVLVLDEPTAGVDIELRRSLWQHVRQLNAQGTTILLTTHYLEEAEELCDEIAIIDHGRIIAQDKTEKLMGKLAGKRFILTLSDKVKTLPKAFEKLNASLDGSRRVIVPFTPEQDMNTLMATMAKAKLSVADIAVEGNDLEDVFMAMTYHRAGRA